MSRYCRTLVTGFFTAAVIMILVSGCVSSSKLQGNGPVPRSQVDSKLPVLTREAIERHKSNALDLRKGWKAVDGRGTLEGYRIHQKKGGCPLFPVLGFDNWQVLANASREPQKP